MPVGNSFSSFRIKGFEAWKPVVESIRGEGCLVMQMFHCGRLTWPEVNPAGRSIAPNAITPKQLNPDRVADLRYWKDLLCCKVADANVAYTETPLP